tara:strand:- start:72 stop:449 length:378 start_codon:yes stop_codon:yes gene_type:complete
MNRYLAFNSDGTLFQECTLSSVPDDDKNYVDISTLDFEPDIFSNVYTLVDGQVQVGSEPEVVIPESVLWRDLRITRNKLLLNSDWTQVSDSPVSKSDWATYRQSLRDLPSNTEDPSNVNWPNEPE